MTEKRQCEVEGCNNPAKYQIFRTLADGSKVWIWVCKKHDRIIGSENMKRAIEQPKAKDGHTACPLCDQSEHGIAVGHMYKRTVYCQKHYKQVKEG